MRSCLFGKGSGTTYLPDAVSQLGEFGQHLLYLPVVSLLMHLLLALLLLLRLSLFLQVLHHRHEFRRLLVVRLLLLLVLHLLALLPLSIVVHLLLLDVDALVLLLAPLPFLRFFLGLIRIPPVVTVPRPFQRLLAGQRLLQCLHSQLLIVILRLLLRPLALNLLSIVVGITVEAGWWLLSVFRLLCFSALVAGVVFAFALLFALCVVVFLILTVVLAVDVAHTLILITFTAKPLILTDLSVLVESTLALAAHQRLQRRQRTVSIAIAIMIMIVVIVVISQIIPVLIVIVMMVNVADAAVGVCV
ncbi:hypothetical protein IWX47DRAFT_872812 [Phyllosticta citricarpa]